MTLVTGWQGGRLNSGLTWTTLINSSDLVSMPNTDTVLSSVADITNGTSLDQFIDISFSLIIASSTIVAGAYIGFWLYMLNQDGTTYGDNQFTAGTQAAKTPTFPPAGTFPLVAAATQTSLIGYIQQVTIPPGSFRFAAQNGSGFALTAGTQTVKYRSYNIRLDNPS
jgi:hypothetical protein